MNSEFDVKDDTTTMLKIGQKDRYQIRTKRKEVFIFLLLTLLNLITFIVWLISDHSETESTCKSKNLLTKISDESNWTEFDVQSD